MATNPVFTSQFDGTFTYGKDSALKAQMFTSKYPSISFDWWTLTQPGERLDGVGGIYFEPRLGGVRMTRTASLGYTTLNGHQVHDWPASSLPPFIANLPKPGSVMKSFMNVSRAAPDMTGTRAPWAWVFHSEATIDVYLWFIPHHPQGARVGFIDEVAGTGSGDGANPGIGMAPNGQLILTLVALNFDTGDYSMSIDGGKTWGTGTLPNWNDLANASISQLYMGKGGAGASYFPGQVPDLMVMSGDVSQNASLTADLQEYARVAWGWSG